MKTYENTERSICTAEYCIFAQISGGLQQADLVCVDAQLALGAVEDAEDGIHQVLNGRSVGTLKSKVALE